MKRRAASNRIDMTGNTYNSWKVVSYSHTKNKNAYWNCECLECGKQQIVHGSNMRLGLSKRCVACGLEHTNNSKIGVSRARSPDDLVYQYIRKAYKHGAKKRKFSFELSLEDIKNLIMQDCDYCGRPPSNKCYPLKGMSMSKANSERSIIRNGIDRVDSSKGYTLDNVVPCCTTCNSAKLDSTRAEFVAWIERVHSHLNSK